MRSEVDALCVGEAMLVLSSDGAIDTASELAVSVGGAEANVARALSRAGRKVAWGSAVGADPMGRRILRTLVDEGVDVSLVDIADAPTGLYLRGAGPTDRGPYYYRSSSAASRMSATGPARWATRIRPSLVHLSGVTAAISASAEELCDALIVDRVMGSALVSFDVNYRPALATVNTPEILLTLARSSDIVFVGRDEAASLWGTSDAASVRTLLPQPRVLVVKDAEVEAVEFFDRKRVAVPSLSVEVVEPTGAGDAFAAAWLDGWLSGREATERIRLGHHAAAAAIASAEDVAEKVDP